VATVVNGFAIRGVDAYRVDVEVDLIFGQPSVTIVGMGDTAVKEARERLQAGIQQAGFEFPKMKIVINLAPSDQKKSGSHFDLPMAIGLLVQSEQLSVDVLHNYGFIGELSLNADLRPCSGVLPMAMQAKELGIQNLIVPRANIKEASLVKDLNVYGFDSLKEVYDFLTATILYEPEPRIMDQSGRNPVSPIDFREVQGQDTLIEFIVLAAAGGHNMLMIGPPGCGKSMIAKRIPTILPSMSEEEALEVTKIYSVAGLLKNKVNLIHQRPFRAPHHNASTSSLVGGGSYATPGEISLSHNGVLFLDEIAEFHKKSLDALRQPIEDRNVTISRVQNTSTYPCNFMLVAAMNPCPCGHYGQDGCRCSDYEVLKYRQRISGPILDRIDIQKYVQAVGFFELSSDLNGRSSSELRERVEAARNIQMKRYENVQGVYCNADISEAMIRQFCNLEEEGKEILQMAYDRYRYSARTFNKFLKVARTFADMEEAPNIRKKDITAALMARDLDKDQSGMMVV
jgi:magnesium chelatase family protein